MRTLPAKFSTDYGSGKDLFYLFVVYLDGGTEYWHTSDKTFDLWPNTAASHGGSALTKQNGYIAQSVDGEQIPLPTIQGSVNIMLGGGIGNVGNCTISLLNQDRLDTTLDAAGMTNRVIEIRKGFVDTVNGVGVNDTLLIKSLLIDEAVLYDYRTIQLTCVDGSFQRHRTIPNIIVDRDNFPAAPERSIGARIPVLYGDFASVNAEEVYTVGADTLNPYHFGEVSGSPTIDIGVGGRKFAVSELGPLFAAGNAWHIASDHVRGRLSTVLPTTIGSNGVISFLIPATAYVDYIANPASQGSQYYANAPVYTWESAADEDVTTYADAVGSGGTMPALFGEMQFGVEGYMQALSSTNKARFWFVYQVPADTGGTGTNISAKAYYPMNPTSDQWELLDTIAVTVGGVAKTMSVQYKMPAPADARIEDYNGMEVGLIAANAAVKIHLFHVAMRFRTKLINAVRPPR